MQYLFYCVVYFKIQRTTKEVFVADVMDVTLANHGVFMQWHAHDAEVTSVWYKKANGIPSLFSNETNSP
jgi:hypothetical protein